jgi:hypothetical protein
VVATCYLLGVSTRRMDKLVETLGITSLSKSQVSVMAKELDVAVEAFRTRPLDAGPYTFVAADALVLKVREGGRLVNVHALIAVGVNAEGHREILGIDVSTAVDGAGWLTFWRSLTARGLSRVRLRLVCGLGSPASTATVSKHNKSIFQARGISAVMSVTRTWLVSTFHQLSIRRAGWPEYFATGVVRRRGQMTEADRPVDSTPSGIWVRRDRGGRVVVSVVGDLRAETAVALWGCLGERLL